MFNHRRIVIGAKGAAVLLAVLILSLSLVTGGCGKSEEAGPGEVEKEEVVEEEPQEEVVEEGAGESEEEEVSVTGGDTEFDLEPKKVGVLEPMPELRIADIRWADHDEYFRIVFEFRNADGSEVTRVPQVSTSYKPGAAPGEWEYWNIFISLDCMIRYQFDFPPFNGDDVPVSLGHPLVKSMERVGTADTEPITFLVRCAYSPAHPGVSSRPHRLMYATHPMRVIVDIRKQ